MWYIEPSDKGVKFRFVRKFPLEDKDTGEVRWMVLREPMVKCHLQRDGSATPAVEVIYSKQGGWKMKFPPVTRERGKWNSSPQREGRYGSPGPLRFEAEELVAESVTTDYSEDALVSRLDKMVGFPLTLEVMAGMTREARMRGLMD